MDVRLGDDLLNWEEAEKQLERSGVALTPPLLSPGECADLIAGFDRDELFRGTVVMARHAFGEGSYRYFRDPLVPVVGELRTRLYPPLARLANRWAERLGGRGGPFGAPGPGPAFPERLGQLLAVCAAAGQHRPTPLLLRYGPGGYNCLHQDVYGDITFPLQVAIMLSTPDVDFTGGESVFVEQRPRAQSRPVVVRPGRGQGVIFPVRDRPVPAARGYKRVVMKHGVSTVHSGRRYVLGVIFHNAR
ncbi:MAG TPA: 2OG-Fe(II) oxygenase [Streptosporangiaceae bacterium]|nr:2OG-Fe(II) oxygenase [Streptosporangiaceae bacterium]